MQAGMKYKKVKELNRAAFKMSELEGNTYIRTMKELEVRNISPAKKQGKQELREAMDNVKYIELKNVHPEEQFLLKKEYGEMKGSAPFPKSVCKTTVIWSRISDPRSDVCQIM